MENGRKSREVTFKTEFGMLVFYYSSQVASVVIHEFDSVKC